MKVLRTPDEQFENLPDFPFEPHYLEIDDGEGGRLRMHYLDEGPARRPDGPVPARPTGLELLLQEDDPATRCGRASCDRSRYCRLRTIGQTNGKI